MTNEWFVEISGKRSGPYTTEQITRAVATGKIQPNTKVNLAGTDQWIDAQSVTDALERNRLCNIPNELELQSMRDDLANLFAVVATMRQDSVDNWGQLQATMKTVSGHTKTLCQAAWIIVLGPVIVGVILLAISGGR